MFLSGINGTKLITLMDFVLKIIESLGKEWLLENNNSGHFSDTLPPGKYL
jgi:hypothetical protein